jgi:hypothetical protein
MKMTRDDRKNADFGMNEVGALASHLSAARVTRPQPSDDLMTRILADARAEQPRARVAVEALTGARRRPGGMRRAFEALGGWGGLGGLSAAGLAGLWIGFAAPGPLAGFADSLPGAVLGGGADETELLLVEMLPEFGDYLTEG